MHKVVQGQYTTCSEKQMARSPQDQVKASIRSLFLADITQKYVSQHGDAIDQTRAARSVQHARERAGKVLLMAANGDNAKPGLAWESFPPELQAILVNMFLQKGWATVLGLAVMKKQLPYCRSMPNKVFHDFIFNPAHKHFIAQWEDTNLWLDEMTPIPASHPWVHLNEMADALTADVVYAMAAQMAELRPYMEAAVADGCLHVNVLLEAQQAAAQPPLSAKPLFVNSWMPRAAAIVGFAALRLLAAGKAASKAASNAASQQLQSLAASRAQVHRASVILPTTPLATDGWGWGSGSGGRCHTALTAVGAGDGGSRVGKVLDVLLYTEGKRAAEVAGAAAGFADVQQQMEPACLRPTSTLLRSMARR